MATGRPSDYSLELSDKICSMLADGKSMRSISKMDGMPVTTTLFRWLRENEAFKQQYEIAKQECADLYAEDIVDIADDSANDYVDAEDQNGATGATRLNTEHVQRSRLRIDARKWVASKLKPKKYGEKIAHGGADDLPPIQTVQLDPKEYAAVREEMLKDDDC